MPARALVIGIEEYPQLADQGSGLGGRKLPGAIRDAVAFYDWLRSDMKLDRDQISLHLSPQSHADARAADFATIQKAVRALRQQGGVEPPAQVFVYYSGHGFQLSDDKTALENDALVCSDFESLQANAYTAFKVGELQAVLRGMGGGQHYFFLDCCRNLVTTEQMVIGTLGINYPRSPRGEAAQFTLSATEAQRATFADLGGTAFTRALLEGLHGSGKSVEWLPPNNADPVAEETLVVGFRTLHTYVESRLERQRPEPRTRGDLRLAIIRTLYPPPPAPVVECRIRVEGVPPTVTLSAQAATNHRPPVSLQLPGGEGVFALPPDDYNLQFLGGNYEVTPAWRHVSLYEKCELTFRAAPRRGLESIGGAPEGAPDLSRPVSVTLQFPPAVAAGWEISGGPGQRVTLPPEQRPGQATVHLPPGRYRAVATELGKAVLEKEFEVRPESDQRVPFTLALPEDPGLRALVEAVGHEDGWALPSESWGPIADRTPGLWLSLLAASVYWPDHNRLATVLGRPEDRTPFRSGSLFLLLATGAADAPAARYWPRSPSGDATALSPQPVRPELPGLWQARQSVRPGPGLVGWEAARARHSLAIHAPPNRVTCVVVVDRRGESRSVNVFWLPLRHLADHLSPDQRPPVYRPKPTVRWLEAAQERLTKGLPLEPPDVPCSDPMIDLLLAYAALRVGDHKSAESRVRSLGDQFPDLADVPALVKLMNPQADAPIHGAPIVQDGLSALGTGGLSDGYPPLSRLDWAGPWTAWLAWPER